MRTLLLLLMSFLVSGLAFGQDHSYLNSMRSSTVSHIFISQSVDGEFGEANMSEAGRDNYDKKWKGYGIGTELGIELMKFGHFSIGHTFMNLSSATGQLESLRGSRLNASTRLVFLSPAGNLEIGGGLLGSRLDYQRQLEEGGFYGSGMFYSLGVNYFMNSKISVFCNAKILEENLVKNNGTTPVRAVRYQNTAMGVGFRLWL